LNKVHTTLKLAEINTVRHQTEELKIETSRSSSIDADLSPCASYQLNKDKFAKEIYNEKKDNHNMRSCKPMSIGNKSSLFKDKTIPK